MASTVRAERKAEREAHKARMAQLKAEAWAHVARGTCPDCGTALVRNSALAGWWQCGAFGSVGFRKPEHRDLPGCLFQCFTD